MAKIKATSSPHFQDVLCLPCRAFLDICDYLEVTPQQFFDSELHNLPLIDKATDLMKQLDDEDMLALISMLNRLALKRK